MINTNIQLVLNTHKFNISYYEIDSITDFEYLIILMTNEAIESEKKLNEVILEFTKGDNDIKTLIEKRFKRIFNTDVDNYKSIKNQAKEMENQTRKLIPSKEIIDIGYLAELELYYYDKKFIDYQTLERKFKDRFNNKNTLFDKINVDETTKVIKDSFTITIDPKFESYDLINIENGNDPFILQKAINKLIKDSHQLIDFDDEDIEYIEDYDESYSTLSRPYNEKSVLERISNFDQFSDGTLVEFDFSNSGKYVITNFVKYRDVILAKEIYIDSSRLYESEKLNALIDLVQDNIDWLSKKYLTTILMNANSREEFDFIRRNNLYQNNKRHAFDLIGKMIEYGINIINDEAIVKSELIDNYLRKDEKTLYEYLNKFYKEEKFNDVPESKKIEILYSVFQSDSKLLSKDDYKYIENILKETNLSKANIEQLVKDISALRPDIKDIEDNLQSRMDMIDNDDDSDESVSLIEELSLVKEKLPEYKRLTNFFVHILDPDNSKYAKDEQKAKKKNKLLPNLKKDLKTLKNDGIITTGVNPEYEVILKEIYNELNEFIKANK